jgi:hypothetical protein
LRKVLEVEKVFNTQRMQSSRDPKEIKRLTEANEDIDRLFSHIGYGNPQTYEDVMKALRAADAAGNMGEAKRLAEKARGLQQ